MKAAKWNSFWRAIIIWVLSGLAFTFCNNSWIGKDLLTGATQEITAWNIAGHEFLFSSSNNHYKIDTSSATPNQGPDPNLTHNDINHWVISSGDSISCVVYVETQRIKVKNLWSSTSCTVSRYTVVRLYSLSTYNNDRFIASIRTAGNQVTVAVLDYDCQVDKELTYAFSSDHLTWAKYWTETKTVVYDFNNASKEWRLYDYDNDLNPNNEKVIQAIDHGISNINVDKGMLIAGNDIYATIAYMTADLQQWFRVSFYWDSNYNEHFLHAGPAQEVINDCGGVGIFQNFSIHYIGSDLYISGCSKGTSLIIRKHYNTEENNYTPIEIKEIDSVYYTWVGHDTLYLTYFWSTFNSSGNNYEYHTKRITFPECNNLSFTISQTGTRQMSNSFPTAYQVQILSDIYKVNKIGTFTVSGSEISLYTIYQPTSIQYQSKLSGAYRVSFSVVDYNTFSNQFLHSYRCELIILSCFRTCSTCYESGTLESPNCSGCLLNYYSDISNSRSCWSETIKPWNYFYDAVAKKFRKCHQACADCEELGDNNNPKCLNCAYGYVALDDQPEKCMTSCPSGYATTLNTCVKCYETCEKCAISGNIKTNNCLICKAGMINHPLTENNCVTPCENYWFIDENFDYRCTATKVCPEDLPYWVVDSNQCVQYCIDKIACPYCNQNTWYVYKKTCIWACPLGTKLDVNSGECNIIIGDQESSSLDNEDSEEGESEDEDEEGDGNEDIVIKPGELVLPSNSVKYEIQGSTEDFLEQIGDSILIAKDNAWEGKVTVMNVNDFSYNIYPNDIIHNDEVTQSTMPTIDWGECEGILRKTYSIPDGEKLLIGQIVFTNDTSSPTNNVEYKVFSEMGVELNLAPCDEVSIEITKTINPEIDGLDLMAAANAWASMGVDLFNISEPIFQSRCVPYQTEDGKDMPLQDRKTNWYQNISFCDIGCELKSIDYTTYKANCECKNSASGLQNLIENNEMLVGLSSLIAATNVDLFACLKEDSIRDLKKWLTNPGNWIVVSITALIIILSILFFVLDMEKIYSYTNSFVHFNPPIKTQNKKKISISSSQNKSSMSEHKVSPTLWAPVEKAAPKEVGLDYTDIELNDMEYDKAMEFDHRGFCAQYFSWIKEKQIIFSTIFSRSRFYTWIIRLIMFLFTMLTFLFFNAMFYTDDYVSQRYNTEGDTNIFYILQNEWLKSVYASIIGMYIGKVLSLLTSIDLKFLKTTRMKLGLERNVLIKSIFLEFKKKFLVLLSIVYVFMVVYWIFLSIFCSWYKSNIVNWVQSTCISIAINVLIPLSFCFLVSLIRFIGKKCKKEFIHSWSIWIYQVI